MINNRRNCYGNTPPIQPYSEFGLASDAAGSRFIPNIGYVSPNIGIGLVPNRPMCTTVFCFHKLDAATGLGIAGSTFALTPVSTSGGAALTSVSDSNGLVTFTVGICCGYLLTETAPAVGYESSLMSYQIMFDRCGCLFVNGEAVERFVIYNEPMSVTPGGVGAFTVFKADAFTGERLAGFEFTLHSEQNVFYTVSASTGAIAFEGVPSGTYSLIETSTPAGYLPFTEDLVVAVTADGFVTINGSPADGYVIFNTPVFDFSFFKLIADTATGLPGAVFELSPIVTVNGVAQPASFVRSAVSAADGRVDFGELSPGEYMLTEVQAPAGFVPYTDPLRVIVAPGGTITVDAIPLGEFYFPNSTEQSMSPTISTVTEGDLAIIGTGIAGCSVVVTLPGGAMVTAVASADGSWAVPLSTALVAGEVLAAVQTCNGLAPSEPIYIEVLPAPPIEVLPETLTAGRATNSGTSQFRRRM